SVTKRRFMAGLLSACSGSSGVGADRGHRLAERPDEGGEAGFELGRRQEAEAEAEDAVLLAEPRAVADPHPRFRQRGMEAGDGSGIEDRGREADAAERAGVGLYPID